MNSLKPWISETTISHRLLALTLASCLGGIPQAFAQAAQTSTPSQGTQATQTAPRQNPNSTLVPDPSKGPLQPAQSQPQDLPNAPSSNHPAPQTTMTAPQDQTQQPTQKVEPPLGAAAAETGRPAGGLASKPAGNAIAPAKQRQVRSMLIKVGAIAAGAAALGIVYGLSRSTSSTPPGATSTAGH
jgi:hypothetical protein